MSFYVNTSKLKNDVHVLKKKLEEKDLENKILFERLKVVESLFERLKVVESYSQNNANSLARVPEELRTEELCKNAIKRSFKSVVYLPESLKTEEMYVYANEVNGRSILFMPIDKITPDVATASLNSSQADLKSLCFAFSFFQEEKIEELRKFIIEKLNYRLNYCYERFDMDDAYNFSMPFKKDDNFIITFNKLLEFNDDAAINYLFENEIFNYGPMKDQELCLAAAKHQDGLLTAPAISKELPQSVKIEKVFKDRLAFIREESSGAKQTKSEEIENKGNIPKNN